MLGEEILAVKFITFALYCALGTGGTAVISQAEMLGGDVALPFVFRAKRARATSE
jgi:hypothetical protein